eukprot:SAG11_NODE_1036_length_6088_cov_9.902655_2_plen_69_part_00
MARDVAPAGATFSIFCYILSIKFSTTRVVVRLMSFSKFTRDVAPAGATFSIFCYIPWYSVLNLVLPGW